MAFTAASAEVLGLKTLEWLVGNDELFMMFLGSSGAGVEDVKAGATDPAFLGAVLDFILMNDEWVSEFCQSENINCSDPYNARQCLPGGDMPNWT